MEATVSLLPEVLVTPTWHLGNGLASDASGASPKDASGYLVGVQILLGAPPRPTRLARRWLTSGRGMREMSADPFIGGAGRG